MTELQQELYDHLWEGLLNGVYIVNGAAVQSGPNRKDSDRTLLEAIADRFKKISWVGWTSTFLKVASDWNNVPLNKALS